MVPLGGCAGPRVKLFQGNHMTSLSFPRGPYDIIIIKWELGFCLHAYGSFGGPEIVKDV